MNKRTFGKIIKILENRYGKLDNKSEDPFKVLITTLLSQRTKDEITEKVAKRFFSIIKTPEDVLKLPLERIEKLIKPVGFYKVKAKRIRDIALKIINGFNSQVPKKREELLSLPGIGNKTADCVLAYAYNKQTIPIDTHVATIAKRLGIAKSKEYEGIQKDLFKVTPVNKRRAINFLLVEFGKEICRTQKPKCEICPIRKWCRFYKTLLQRS